MRVAVDSQVDQVDLILDDIENNDELSIYSIENKVHIL